MLRISSVWRISYKISRTDRRTADFPVVCFYVGGKMVFGVKRISWHNYTDVADLTGKGCGWSGSFGRYYHQ